MRSQRILKKGTQMNGAKLREFSDLAFRGIVAAFEGGFRPKRWFSAGHAFEDSSAATPLSLALSMPRLLALYLCLISLPAIAANPPGATNAVDETQPATPAATQQETAAAIPSPIVPMDPFVYHAQGQDSMGFVPAPESDLPRDIAVLATAKIQNGKAWAVLSIGDSGEVDYVTEDTVVSVQSAAPPRTSAGSASYNARVYLLIHKITGDTVEISPHQRPQDIHIYQ